MQRAVRGGAGTIHLEAGAGRQKINAVLAFREHRPGRRIGIAHDQQFELFDAANGLRHSRDGVDAVAHDEHGLQIIGLRDLIFRQQRGVKPARARNARTFHQRLAGEAGAHPVEVDFPDPAPMPPRFLGQAVIERQRRHIEAEIGGALHIGMAAENIGAAAGMPDIAGREQQNAARADICRAGGELRLAHRPDQRGGLLVSEKFGDVLDLGFGQAGDALDLVRRPFRDFLADILDAVDALVNEFLVLPAILEDVPEHPVDRGDVDAGPYPDIFGRVRRRSRHARVDDDQVGAVEFLAFENVLQRNRMRFGGIAAHDQNGLGVADVVVAVGHRTVAPGIGYTGDGRGMADARLMIGIVGSPKGRELAVEIGGFVGEFGGTEPVDRIRSRLLADIEKLVADLIDGLIPRKPGPSAVHQLYGITQTALAQHVVANRRSLAAMRSAIDRAVVIRLLADPHAVCDFGNDRAADRAMGAYILAGRNGRAGRRRRTGFRFPHTAERQIAESRQAPAAIPERFRKVRRSEPRWSLPPAGSGSSANAMTFRPPDQHGCLPYGRG